MNKAIIAVAALALSAGAVAVENEATEELLITSTGETVVVDTSEAACGEAACGESEVEEVTVTGSKIIRD